MATGRPLRVTGALTAFRTGCVMWSIPFLITLITTSSANAVTESLEVKFAGSCDFETEDLCGYVQGEQDDFDWMRRTGPTPSLETGPDFDHTLGANGSGHYAYIEGTGVHAWNAAHLISPSLAPLPTYCLHFFYHMYGEDTGQLSVKVSEGAEVGNPERVWSMLQEQGNVWLNASVDIPCVIGCKIIFEAQPGRGFWSDIAIDDVTVTNGSCFPAAFVTTSPQMTTTEKSTSTKAQTTHTLPPTATGSTRSPTLDYEIIEYQYDEHFITIILAVGLTFWSVVFGLIFILFCFCDKRPNGRRFEQHRRSNIDMEVAEPVKLGLDTTRCTESDEYECEEIKETDGNSNEETTLNPDRTGINRSDSSSIDSERYSVPVITTPKPSRGPSPPPPCGYMSLQQDSFNNNAAYQPLAMSGISA